MRLLITRRMRSVNGNERSGRGRQIQGPSYSKLNGEITKQLVSGPVPADDASFCDRVGGVARGRSTRLVLATR